MPSRVDVIARYDLYDGGCSLTQHEKSVCGELSCKPDVAEDEWRSEHVREVRWDVDSRWSKIDYFLADGCTCELPPFHYKDGKGNTLTTIRVASPCPACSAWDRTRKILPPMFRWVHHRRLAPYEHIATPIAVQRRVIEEIRNGELTGHSVLFSGDSKWGKTTLACALLSYMVEDYVLRGGEMSVVWHLPIYRINCDEWIKRHEAHANHQYGSNEKRPPQPEPNVKSILSLPPSKDDYGCAEEVPCPDGFSPILLLEEIDKFNATETRIKNLYTLLNKVFEAGGMIISTTNERELDSRFPNWFVRRLMESSQDGKLRHRNFWKIKKASKKAAGVE